MKVTATATPNIALIKYWGNRNNALRLPAADSLSMTLNEPSITLSLEASDAPVLRSFMMDGTEKELKPQEIQRFTTVIDFARRYIATLHGRDVLPHACAIDIRSAVPPRIGLASSAAVFAAFAKAIAGLVRSDIALTDAQTSVIARFGAGSAARSIFGGFASIHAGIGDAIDSAYAQSIADETTWNLHDIVIVPSHEEKKYGSTEGHALAHTSPYFAERIRQIPRRMEECIAAIQRKDFEKLQRVSEEDALDMRGEGNYL
jgi:diphosphomevalonate decarboxylase